MKNSIMLHRAAVLLLVLALLIPGACSGAEGNGHSDDLADFLDSVVISGAELNDQGQYVILQGVPYTIQMNFKEETAGVQFATPGPLTYQFPGGFTPMDASGTVEMTGDGGIVRFDYVISGNTLTVSDRLARPGQAYTLSFTAYIAQKVTGQTAAAAYQTAAGITNP